MEERRRGVRRVEAGKDAGPGAGHCCSGCHAAPSLLSIPGEGVWASELLLGCLPGQSLDKNPS